MKLGVHCALCVFRQIALIRAIQSLGYNHCIEHFVGEIERISLNIDEGDEHVNHVKR